MLIKLGYLLGRIRASLAWGYSNGYRDKFSQLHDKYYSKTTMRVTNEN